jgi:hypothetical protein
MSVHLFVGHSRITSATPYRTTQQYTPEGLSVWSADHGAQINAITVDAAGNIYTGGVSSGGVTTRKYSNTGALLWSANSYSTVTAIAVDTSGNVYTANLGSGSYGNTAKFTSDGTPLWMANYGGSGYGIAIAPNGEVIVVHAAYSSKNITKLNAQYGNRTGYGNIGGGSQLNGIVLLNGEIAYIVGSRTYAGGYQSLWRVNYSTSTPVAEWGSAAHGSSLLCVGVDASGNIYAGGNRLSNITTRKFSSDGTELWNADHGGYVYALGVAKNNQVFVCGDQVGARVKQYNPDGTVVSSFEPGSSVKAIIVVTDAAQTFNSPSLPFPLAVVVPSTGFSVRPNGIPIALSLGLFTSAALSAPPDLTLIHSVYRQVYRLYLLTSTGMIELPLSAIQCRRRVGASTWLTAEIPVYTPSLGIQCHNHIGSEISIYAGVVDGNGERIGEFLRAELTEVNRSWSPDSGSIVLTARVDNPYFTAQSRSLLGVVSRGADDGRHTVVCAVDPLLRPNDTVFDGVESWIAGNIAYRISAMESQMTVTEEL